MPNFADVVDGAINSKAEVLSSIPTFSMNIGNDEDQTMNKAACPCTNVRAKSLLRSNNNAMSFIQVDCNGKECQSDGVQEGNSGSDGVQEGNSESDGGDEKDHELLIKITEYSLGIFEIFFDYVAAAIKETIDTLELEHKEIMEQFNKERIRNKHDIKKVKKLERTMKNKKKVNEGRQANSFLRAKKLMKYANRLGWLGKLVEPAVIVVGNLLDNEKSFTDKFFDSGKEMCVLADDLAFDALVGALMTTGLAALCNWKTKFKSKPKCVIISGLAGATLGSYTGSKIHETFFSSHGKKWDSQCKIKIDALREKFERKLANVTQQVMNNVKKEKEFIDQLVKVVKSKHETFGFLNFDDNKVNKVVGKVQEKWNKLMGNDWNDADPVKQKEKEEKLKDQKDEITKFTQEAFQWIRRELDIDFQEAQKHL